MYVLNRDKKLCSRIKFHDAIMIRRMYVFEKLVSYSKEGPTRDKGIRRRVKYLHVLYIRIVFNGVCNDMVCIMTLLPPTDANTTKCIC